MRTHDEDADKQSVGLKTRGRYVQMSYSTLLRDSQMS